MIRLLDFQADIVPMADTYVTSDRSAAFVGNVRGQEEEDAGYRSLPISAQGRLTVDGSGGWADFEWIGPDYVDRPLCGFAADPWQEAGTPLLAVEASDALEAVQIHGKGFTVWLAKGEEITKVIHQDGVAFFIAGDRLVGISVAVQRRPEGV